MDERERKKRKDSSSLNKWQFFFSRAYHAKNLFRKMLRITAVEEIMGRKDGLGKRKTGLTGDFLDNILDGDGKLCNNRKMVFGKLLGDHK